MRTKLHRWFWVWEYQKEEQWLNDMAKRGMALTSVSFCTYVFEDAKPGEYQFRLELLAKRPDHEDSRKYLRFLEETGIEYIGSVLDWVYLRRRTDGAEFEIYSDHESQLKFFQRIRNLLTIPMPFLAFGGLWNFIFFAANGFVINLFAGLLTIPVLIMLVHGRRKVRALEAELDKQRQLFE